MMDFLRSKSKRRQLRKKRLYAEIGRQKGLQLALRYQDYALHSTEPGVSGPRERPLIVTLTTMRSRINDVYLCIESLLQQSLKPDKVVLWLSTEEFSGHDVPELLRKQQLRGLEIAYCDRDLGSYKKIHYALQQYPDALLLTVDDDTIYPVDLLDQLYRAHLQQPDVVHCLRAHKVKLAADGTALPYKRWDRSTDDSTASSQIFPTGVGGVLYFPGCFDSAVLDSETFLRLAPNADDIWLKAMTTKRGVLSKKVADERPWALRFFDIPGSQLTALKRTNKTPGRGNDEKLKAVFDEYQLWDALSD